MDVHAPATAIEQVSLILIAQHRYATAVALWTKTNAPSESQPCVYPVSIGRLSSVAHSLIELS